MTKYSPLRGVTNGSAIVREDELGRFLSSIGLGHHLPPLLQHEVDLVALSRMSEQELEELGIHTVGARKRILLEFERRKQYAKDPAPASATAPSSGVGDDNGGGALLTSSQLAAHIQLLSDFFLEHCPPLEPRAAQMVKTFGKKLDALYAALCLQYKIPISPQRAVVIAHLREHHAHMLGAADVICDVWEGREAEYVESLELERLGLQLHPLTWTAHVAAGEDEGAENDNVYYHCALVDMCQWALPTALVNASVATVRPLQLSSACHSTRNLPSNPTTEDDNRGQSHQFIATIVALLMRKDPQRLTQLEELLSEHRGREALLLDDLTSLYGKS